MRFTAFSILPCLASAFLIATFSSENLAFADYVSCDDYGNCYSTPDDWTPDDSGGSSANGTDETQSNDQYDDSTNDSNNGDLTANENGDTTTGADSGNTASAPGVPGNDDSECSDDDANDNGTNDGAPPPDGGTPIGGIMGGPIGDVITNTIDILTGVDGLGDTLAQTACDACNEAVSEAILDATKAACLPVIKKCIKGKPIIQNGVAIACGVTVANQFEGACDAVCGTKLSD